MAILNKATCILLLTYWSSSLACDIFLASKCPSPPVYQAETFNYTAFCKETSDFVDCINKKLKNCKRVQEYGPALETIKWTFKLSIKNVNFISYVHWVFNFFDLNYLDDRVRNWQFIF